MTIKKILALIGLALIVTAAAIILLNTFWPNPYTRTVITFATVTAPAYLMSKLEWVMGSIGATCSVIGVAMKKINNTKEQAAQAVSSAQKEATQAKSLASDQFGEVQKITEERNALQEQINKMNANRTAAEQLATQQENTITAQKKQITDLREDLRLLKVQTATVEVVK